MKQFIFSPIDESYFVSYLTNAVGTNDRLFINEIKHSTDGENWLPGLGASGAAVSLFGDYLETTLTLMKAKAVALNMNLRVYEDRHAESNINDALCNFLTYSLGVTDEEVVIDHDALTIDVSVPYGTTVTALVATFTLTNSATAKISSTAQVSGTTPNNFTAAKTYRITAKDTVTYKDYVVTVTVLPEE